MAIEGTIPFGGTIAVTATTDTYAVLGTEYTRGGLKSVENEAARLAITDARRELGMQVYQQDTKETWTLKNGLTNSDWEIVKFSMDEIDGGEFE